MRNDDYFYRRIVQSTNGRKANYKRSLCVCMLFLISHFPFLLPHSPKILPHFPINISLSSFLFPLSSKINAQTQKGNASFYSRNLSGQRTANGERLHPDSLTCAHKTYPFGTLLKVTNPESHQSVIVRVTDRGPYVRGRIIDLSIRAAREIGIIAQGIAPVIVEHYKPAVVPFKPDDTLELPDFEIGTNDGTATKPIWVALKEDRDRKRKEQQAREQEKARKKSLATAPQHPIVSPAEAPAMSAPSVPPTKKEESNGEDLLKHINNTPNKSKAYQKRHAR